MQKLRQPVARQTKAFFLFALLSVLLLAGCADTPPTPTPAPPPVTETTTPGTAQIAAQPDALGEPAPEATVAPTPTPSVPTGRIVLWHSWTGRDTDALAAILADFNRLYPAVTVDTLFVGYNDLPQAYADAVTAGGGPDLVFCPSWWVDDLAQADALLPLDSLLTADDLAGYSPGALEAMRWKGQLVGLPVTVETVGLYVNTALWPADQTPATTDDWLALVQSDPTAGSGLYANLYHLVWGIPAYGGRLMDEDGLVVLADNNGAADFLGWLYAMSKSQGNFVHQDYGMLLDRFKKGEFPFLIDGPWAAADLRQALGDQLTVVPLPAGPVAAAQPWLSADGLMLNPVTTPAQQTLALLLAEQLSGPAGGAQWAALAGRIPAHSGADIGADPILAGFLAQAAAAQAMPTRAEMDQVWGYAGDMLIKVIGDVLSPADAVVEASALINEANRK